MTNDKFTNKSDIEYPLEEDFVDVKVLNNNTRLLDTKKANVSDLQNVAKESEPKIIENKIIELENRLNSFIEKDKIKNWTLLPNLKETTNNAENNGDLVDITGKGNLIMCTFSNILSGIQGSLSFKIEIDGQIVFNVKVNFNDTSSSNYNNMGYVGIVNTTKYSYIDTNNLKTNLSLPIIQTGLYAGNDDNKICLTANIHSMKKLHSTKQVVTNDDFKGQLGNKYSNGYNYYIPLQVPLDMPLRFEKSLKVTVYDKENYQRKGNGITCYTLYNLDV